MRKLDARKIYAPKVYAIVALAAALVLIPAGASHAGLLGSKKTKLPAGLPKKWDKKIPIPPGAVVAVVNPPSGIVQTVEFSAPGEFDGLVNFYNSELTKAGFQLGPHVEVPTRKAYNLNFSKASVQDSVSNLSRPEGPLEVHGPGALRSAQPAPPSAETANRPMENVAEVLALGEAPAHACARLGR